MDGWADCAEIPGWKVKRLAGLGTAIWNGRHGTDAVRHATRGGLAMLKQWATG